MHVVFEVLIRNILFPCLYYKITSRIHRQPSNVYLNARDVLFGLFFSAMLRMATSYAL